MANPLVERQEGSGSLTRAGHGGAGRAYDEREPIDVKNLLNVVRRRKAVLLLTVFLGTGLAALAAALIAPRYTATAALMIQPPQARVIEFAAIAGESGPDEGTIETQVRYLASRGLAERIVQELNLVSDPEFNPALEGQGERSPAMVKLLQDAEAAARAFVAPVNSSAGKEPSPEATGAPYSDQLEAAVASFLQRLEVGRSGRSYVVSLSFTSTDPNKAARIVNTVARTYVESQLADKLATTTTATEWLQERVEQLREEVLEAERKVEEYRAAHQLAEDRGTALIAQQLAVTDAALIAARAELTDKEARLEQVRQISEDGGLDAIPEVMASPFIVMLREQETALVRQKAQLSREYGERHPLMVQVEAERQDLAVKIDREARNIIQTLEDDVMAARRRVRALEQSLAEARKHSAVIGQAGIQLAELEREAAAKRAIYESILSRLMETREQPDLLQADARVISAALVPSKVSFPKPTLMVVSGFAASLMLGVLLAFLTEHLDRRLRTGRHLEELLGVTSLGLVPAIRPDRGRQKHHQYLLERPLSEYAESIRSIGKSLQLSNVDRPPQVVMVTSTLPGEGKTTLAASLAASSAASGRSTILVDLDLRHPSVAREMRQPVKADLIDFMTGTAALEDIIYTAPSVDGLAYIPIRQLTGSPLNLLESQKMSSLIADLRAHYAYVVLDTPPALGITDTRTTAVLADAVLFVVCWQRTRVEPAQKGLELLLQSHARVAGAVLTQVNLRRLGKLAYGDAAEYHKSYQAYYRN